MTFNIELEHQQVDFLLKKVKKSDCYASKCLNPMGQDQDRFYSPTFPTPWIGYPSTFIVSFCLIYDLYCQAPVHTLKAKSHRLLS